MKLRVAAVQPALVAGGVEVNLLRVEDLVRDAAAAYRPDLIVLPDVLGAESRPVDGAPFVLLRELARELGCVVTGGALLVRGGDAYSTYLALEADGRAHLHDDGVLCDVQSRHLRRGDDDGITAISAWDRRPIGLVCGPEWARTTTARRLRVSRVELVVGGRRDGSRREAELMARHVGAPAVMTSHAGGTTCLCDGEGNVLASLAREEGHVCAVVELGSRADVPSLPGSSATRRGAGLPYRVRKAARRFPWQQVPSADVPDEIGPRRSSPTPMPATIPVVVEEVRAVAEDTVGLTLRAKDRGPLPTWTPGSHIDVILDEHTIRQYSLCGDPTGATYEIAILREPDGRGGSMRICDTVRPGDEFVIRGPRNHFRFTAGAKILFLTGGIGITPILAMVREAAACGLDWRLIYTARCAGRIGFRDELLALGTDRVEIRTDDIDGLLCVADVIGNLTPTTHVYACGPTGLLTAVEEACDRHQLRLRIERFTTTVADPAEDREFELVAATSKLTVRVAPHQSALSALRHAGVAVDTACENGVCGSCQVRVLHGTPDQRDTITTRRGAQTRSVMMLCVSRACTDSITVDI